MLRSLPHSILLFGAIMLVASCGVGENLHQVDAKVWRSSQPDRKGFSSLEISGIREVLNLRRFHSDDELVDGLVCHHVRMRAGAINDDDMLEALRVLRNAKGPILVHCLHGSDRTGAVIAMYRMVVQRWPRDRAIGELMDPKYGHHQDTFPNIKEYLEKVDVEKFRRKLR